MRGRRHWREYAFVRLYLLGLIPVGGQYWVGGRKGKPVYNVGRNSWIWHLSRKKGMDSIK